VASIVGWFGYSYLVESAPLLNWQEYSHSKLEMARNSKQTVMVDFTATWCQTCKWNLFTAIDTPEVLKQVKEYNIIALKADQTHENQENDELLEKLNRKSIPVLAIFPANDPLNPIILDDLVTKAQVLESLKKAGPSIGANASAAMSEKSELTPISVASESK
jgi:suppressor for copper-sensitivity B